MSTRPTPSSLLTRRRFSRSTTTSASPLPDSPPTAVFCRATCDPSASITTTLMSRLSPSDDSSFSSPIRRRKFYFARTGWLTIALLPTPVAFILLAASSGTMALHAGTALIGLSSGFIFAAAVSITSELFGVGVWGWGISRELWQSELAETKRNDSWWRLEGVQSFDQLRRRDDKCC